MIVQNFEKTAIRGEVERGPWLGKKDGGWKNREDNDLRLL
jgi:hypothetical protein